MRKILMMLWLSGLSICTWAQVVDSTETVGDTVNLEEVTIASNLPLDNDDVLDFFRTNHFATIDNINARLDGMSLIKRGAYAMEPQLNGFSGGQLNVTIDGMRMFGACTDKMDPITSYIEPSNLKNITIKHGTDACQSGCNIGGSVDMTLQEPSTKNIHPFNASVGFGYETVSNSRNILFSSGFTKNKWAFGFDGVYRKNENYKSGENKTIPFSQFQKANIHSVLKYSPNKINSFKIDLLYDDAQNVGYPALPMDVGSAKAALFALEYERKSKVQFKMKMYVNTIHHVMDDSKRDSLYFLENESVGKTDSVYMHMDMPGKSSTIGAYALLTILIDNKNKLILKADNFTNSSLAEMTMHMRYAGQDPEPPMYMQTWPAMLRNVSGIFVQNTTYFTQNFMLTLNGRMDYNIDILQSEYGQQQFSVFNYTLEKQQSKLLKSFNLLTQYYLINCLSINSTLGYSERMPTIGERLGYYLYNAYDGYDYIGNPDIHPEKSEYFSLAFLLSKPNLKINISQSLSLVNDYIMGISDTLIPSMNFYANGTRVYSNIHSVMLYSSDLQVLYNPIKSLSVFLITKFTIGKMNSGQAMPLIPPLKNIVSIKYEKERFTVQGESEMSLAQNRINTNYGEIETPAYTIFNAKCAYSFSITKSVLNLSLGITNLFNNVYYEHLDWGRIYRPGRSFELFVGFTY